MHVVAAVAVGHVVRGRRAHGRGGRRLANRLFDRGGDAEPRATGTGGSRRVLDLRTVAPADDTLLCRAALACTS